MKIYNHTKWQTKPMRSVFAKCLAEIRRREGKRWELSGQIVSVKTHRARWGIGGCAAYHSRHLTIKVPIDAGSRPELNSAKLADTYIHEVGHNLGVKHNRARDTFEHLFQEWIKTTFGDTRCFTEKAKTPKPNPIEGRYQKAVSNLALARTRLKRATTLFRKWHRASAYYEKAYTFGEKK